MPNVTLTLPEVEQSISRPIIFDIIKQVNEITKIDKSTKIFFPGDIQKMQTYGSDIDKSGDRFPIFNTDRYTFIDVVDDYDLDTLASTAVTSNEHIPIFLDNKLQVRISPIYATSNVTINFKHSVPSKTEALRWRDDMRTRASMARRTNLHKISYHYLLPEEILKVLKEVYDARENKLGYNQTFAEYVTSYASDRLTVVGDLIGSESRLAISETQFRIVGLFDFEGLPDKPEKDDGTGNWIISFSYKFNYEKPISCNMKYPIMVHNQLLSPEYTYFTNKTYMPHVIDKSASMSIGAFSEFELDQTLRNTINTNAIIRLPNFDDYIIPVTPRGTATGILALCEVDETDNKTLLNLNELGDIVFDNDILDFIRESEYPYCCDIYKSIITISLYRNNTLVSNNSIECLTDLTIKAKVDLDIRNQYRLRIGLVTDLTLLSKEAISRLLKFPKAFIKIIAVLNELLRDNPDFINLGDKKKISAIDFSNVYRILTGYDYLNGSASCSSNWINTNRPSCLFSDIDPLLLERYRRERVGKNTVLLTGIIAVKE